MKPAWGPLRRTISQILQNHGVRSTLSVALVGDEEIRRLHREFLGEDSPTDVLAFPLGSPEGGPDEVFGEVVVSAETALREARRRKLDPERELALYAVHGTLHLVGFDDKSADSRRRMRREERRYLELFDSLG